MLSLGKFCRSHNFLFVFTEGPTKEFTLAAGTTETLLSDLIPEIEYVVTITSYDEVEESVPVIGQLTSKSTYKLKYFNIIPSFSSFPFIPPAPTQCPSSNSFHVLPTSKRIASFSLTITVTSIHGCAFCRQFSNFRFNLLLYR